MFHLLLEITYKCLLDGAHIIRKTCLQNYRSIILGSLLGVWCPWCISVCSNQYTNLRCASLHYGYTHWIIHLNIPSFAWDHVQMFPVGSLMSVVYFSLFKPIHKSAMSLPSLRAYPLDNPFECSISCLRSRINVYWFSFLPFPSSLSRKVLGILLCS